MTLAARTGQLCALLRTRLLFLVFASILASTPCPALADEAEWVIAVEPGLGFFDAANQSTQVGAGAQLSLWIGLTEASWLFLSGGGEGSLGSGPNVVEGVFGAVAALDVLRVIPFLELGGGLDRIGDHVSPLLRIGAGADYLLTPSLGIGLVVRYRPLFGQEGEGWITAHLRLSWRGEF